MRECSQTSAGSTVEEIPKAEQGDPRPPGGPSAEASTKPIKVNLGGGGLPIPGYVRLGPGPNRDGEVADILVDLEEGLPFANDSIDVINASHVFQRISNFTALMNDSWRVLKDDGFMMVTVPIFPSDAAVGPPDHVRYFTRTTFKYFERAWCPPGRSPWVIEVTREITGRFFPLEAESPQLFVLMRPDRGRES